MTHTAHTEWKEGFAFDVTIGRHTFTIDTNQESGGNDTGPSPKRLLLAGLSGCTGMDVVSILGKMKMPLDGFSMDVEADQQEAEPRIYTAYRIVYNFRGKDLDRAKIEKAVNLSREKYCGVWAMLEKTAPISFEIRLNPEGSAGTPQTPAERTTHT